MHVQILNMQKCFNLLISNVIYKDQDLEIVGKSKQELCDLLKTDFDHIYIAIDVDCAPLSLVCVQDLYPLFDDKISYYPVQLSEEEETKLYILKETS